VHRPQNRDLKNLKDLKKKMLRVVLIGIVASASALRVAPFAATGNVRAFVSANAKSLYSLTAKKSDGTTLDLKSLSGKPCLMVNVASR
jgi:hypothetical protein